MVKRPNPSSQESSYEAAGSTGGGGGGGGIVGWVRGLFLPPAFDSLPLPLVAVLLHALLVLVAPLLVLKGRRRAASIAAPRSSADGPQQESADTAATVGGESKSLMETMAHSMGLGPLLGKWEGWPGRADE